MKEILQFFEYRHLPENLQIVSKAFAQLANDLTTLLPENQETSTGLRKLLEAKDCFVRSMLLKLKEDALSQYTKED